MSGNDPNQDELIRQWLRAEATGDDSEAENRLTALFAGLPRPAPAPGFAERVMATAAQPRVEPIGWSVGLAFAACVLMVAAAAPLLPAFTTFVLELFQGLGVAGRTAVVVADLSGAMVLVHWLVRLVDVLFDVLTTLPVLAAIVVAALVATVSVRGLDALLSPRRLRHAPTPR